jgi:hypothetical protein
MTGQPLTRDDFLSRPCVFTLRRTDRFTLELGDNSALLGNGSDPTTRCGDVTTGNPHTRGRIGGRFVSAAEPTRRTGSGASIWACTAGCTPRLREDIRWPSLRHLSTILPPIPAISVSSSRISQYGRQVGPLRDCVGRRIKNRALNRLSQNGRGSESTRPIPRLVRGRP